MGTSDVDIAGLKVVVETSLKDFERQMARLNGITLKELRKTQREMEKGVSKIEKSWAGLGSKVGRHLKAALSVGAILAAGAAIRDLVSEASKIGDLADRIGATTDTIQSLTQGAVQADMSFEDMGKNLLKFTRSIGAAKNGSGELLKLLRANNLQVADTFEGNLNQFADLVAGAETEADKLLILQQVMGKGADGWIEVFEKGSAGLRGFNTELTKSGTKIDEALIRKAQDLDDRWAALMESMKRSTQGWVLNTISAWQQVWSDVSNPPPGAQSAFMQLTGQPGPFDEGFGGPKRTKRTGPTSAPVANFGGAGSYYKPPATVMPNPEDEAAAKKAIQAKIDQAEAIDKVIEALKFEAQQLVASDLQQEINTQLRAADVTATSAQGQAIIELVKANFELARSIEEATAAGDEAAKKREEQTEALKNDAIELRDAFKSTWTEIGMQIARGDVSLKDFAQSLEGLQSKVTQMALDKSFEILFNMLANYFAPGSSAGVQFPGRLGGGDVRGGQAYEVGEGGREVFVPDADGKIVPNATLMAGIGGRSGGLQINNYAPGLVFERRTVRRNGDRQMILAIREQVATELGDSTSKSSRVLNVRGAPVPQKRRN